MAKSTLTPDKIARLAEFIRMGAPMKDVFAASQVTKSTYHRWMGIGRALSEDDLEHPGIPKRPTRRASESDRRYNRRLRRHDELLERHVTFYKTMKKAAALCQVDMLLIIRSAYMERGIWRAALWRLQRSHPNDWCLQHILRSPVVKQHPFYSVNHPDFLELFRAIAQWERSMTMPRQNNIDTGASNGPDSLP